MNPALPSPPLTHVPEAVAPSCASLARQRWSLAQSSCLSLAPSLAQLARAQPSLGMLAPGKPPSLVNMNVHPEETSISSPTIVFF